MPVSEVNALPQHGRKKGKAEDIIHEPIPAKTTVLRFLRALTAAAMLDLIYALIRAH